MASVVMMMVVFLVAVAVVLVSGLRRPRDRTSTGKKKTGTNEKAIWQHRLATYGGLGNPFHYVVLVVVVSF